MKNNWSPTKLDEVLLTNLRIETINPLKEYPLLGVRLEGQGPFHRETKFGSQLSSKSLFKVKAGDFIYSRLFAWRGAFGVVPSEFDGYYVSGEFPTFTPHTAKINVDFLRYWFRLKPTILKVEADCTGSTPLTRNRFKEKFFLALQIPLPPLAAQRRIVARIEALAGKIAEARGLRQQAVEEAEAVLESSINYVFEKIGHRKVQFERLSELTSKIGSGSTPKGGRSVYLVSGIPFIRSLNIRMRKFQWNDMAYIDPNTHSTMKSTWIKSNDVLLNITGASIGRVACAPPDMREGNVNQHVAIIRPTEKLSPRFLMFWLSQPKIQDFINSEQKGATRQGFTKAQIEKLEIPLLPLGEQRRIVAYLDGLQAKVDALKNLQAETQRELEVLLPSVLEQAFREAL